MLTEPMPWPRLLLSGEAKVLKQRSHPLRQIACCDAACFSEQVYSDGKDTRRRSAEFVRDFLARVLAISVTAVCGPIDPAIKRLSGPSMKVPILHRTIFETVIYQRCVVVAFFWIISQVLHERPVVAVEIDKIDSLSTGMFLITVESS